MSDLLTHSCESVVEDQKLGFGKLRRKYIEISGILANVTDGDLQEKVLQILKKIDVEIASEDIASYMFVIELVKKYLAKKDINLDSSNLLEEPKLYINENAKLMVKFDLQ